MIFDIVSGFCEYKGKKYHKGDTWDDACSYKCECIDEASGAYTCTERSVCVSLRIVEFSNIRVMKAVCNKKFFVMIIQETLVSMRLNFNINFGKLPSWDAPEFKHGLLFLDVQGLLPCPSLVSWLLTPMTSAARFLPVPAHLHQDHWAQHPHPHPKVMIRLIWTYPTSYSHSYLSTCIYFVVQKPGKCI